MLYGPDGSAVAEFCDDQVTASAVGGDEQQWREWELELAEGGELGLFERLTNRLLDAGALPAGHGSKLARVLEGRARSGRRRTIRRSAASGGGRARRGTAGMGPRGPVGCHDSVHQMRVTTRKIRSLLQSSEGSFGITDDEWILEELRALAGVLGVARDAEVLAERYDLALDELPESNVRGPVGSAGRGRREALPERLEALADGDALTTLFPAPRRAGGVGGG